MNNAYKNYTNAQKVKKTVTPQTKVIPGREKDMVKNSAGGATFQLDEFGQLDRFLILGSEGGSFYTSERKLTKQNAKNVIKAIELDGVRVVNRIVEISDAGRAPKNDPALFALALVFAHGDDAAKAAAAEALPKVARIGTHVFHLAAYLKDMQKWGRSVRKGFANWYNGKSPLKLAEQLTKYANRDGWTHRDVLRMVHVKPVSPTHDALFTDVVGKAKNVEIDANVAEYMAAVEELKQTKTVSRAVALIQEHNLPREIVPTELLNKKEIWEALLPHMGMEAMIRNLATMTRNGVVAPLSDGTKQILAKMSNVEAVQKSRLHPIKVLMALLTYQSGQGRLGSNSWTPNRQIVDALDELFYNTFQNVVPTGKNIMLALDVSASMTWANIAGIDGLTPRVGSAAMAMMTARTEQNWLVTGFSHGIKEIKVSPRERLDNVVDVIERTPMGGTDCALPMIWAMQNKIGFDAFVVYTDNETWAGSIHPVQALKQYRDQSGIPAKLIVCGMTATDFTIADPNDAGSLDVVGFDAAAPAVMSDFIAGNF